MLEVLMRSLPTTVLFLVATSSFAQAPPVLKNLPATTFTTGQTVVITGRLPGNFGCPVGFSATRQAAGQMMSADDAKQKGPAQGLHLELQHINRPAIESIEVTVYGRSPKQGILLIDSEASVKSDDAISKTFELQRKAESRSLTDADVWMHNVGSLTRVDLNTITYSDGSTWHSTENFKCRAVPSNFILVGSK
jgi:hypothetical protein